MFSTKSTSRLYLSILFLPTLILLLAQCEEKKQTEVDAKFEYDERYIFLKEINEHSNRTSHTDQEVPSSVFPYVVALLDNFKKIQCTGTIIGPTHILTAAHCAKISYVYAKKEDKGIFLQILRYIQHPFFSYKYVKTRFGKTVSQLKNDIAIVSTYDSLITYGGRPIALNLEIVDNIVRKIGTGLGYGKRKKKEDLSKIRLADVELDTCFEYEWSYTICGITPIYNLFSSGICSGDSGGPLVYDGNLLGIGSLGQAECGTDVEIKEVLVVYTLVSAYKDWVHNVTKIYLNNL